MASGKAPMFTDREKDFFLRWKRIFNGSTPADWSIPQIDAGISSFQDWRDLLNREATSLDVLEQCLKTLKREKGYPSYHDVVSLYHRRVNKGQAGEGGRATAAETCSACNGTGVVIFPQILRAGRVYCLDPRKPPPTLRRGEYVGQGTAPCLCPAGDKQNATWGMDHGPRQRCHRCRVTQSEFDNWLYGPVKAGDAGSAEINSALTHLTATVAATALADDDARRRANADQWAGVEQEERF